MAMQRGALARSAFLILLALTDRPRHGLGIVDEVEEHTSGRIKLGPGTLYGMLKQLEYDDLIAESRERPDVDDDPRRKYYRLTPGGLEAVRGEAEQMRVLVTIAEGKNVLEARG